jgi:N-carbamoylputrescine amidase
MPAPRTLRVAAVQVQSRDGGGEANLARAEPFVAQAAARGARLVLCPEFLAAGYVYDESIWGSGEPAGGPTEAWLRRLAAAHRVYVGATYLEVEGDDFYNTFALAAPDGTVAGRVRKESLPAFEGWFFKSCGRPKVIDTELGRISVGICQDNHTARFFRRVLGDEPDLILMPHSAPCVSFGGPIMREGLREIAPYYARSFGVPVVLANKATGRSRSPVPGVPLVRLPFDFPGLSSVVDSDGRVAERLGADEGVAVADVTIDPARKRRPETPTNIYWSRRPTVLPRLLGAFSVVFEYLGRRAYARNPARAAAARATALPTARVNGARQTADVQAVV